MTGWPVVAAAAAANAAGATYTPSSSSSVRLGDVSVVVGAVSMSIRRTCRINRDSSTDEPIGK